MLKATAEAEAIAEAKKIAEEIEIVPETHQHYPHLLFMVSYVQDYYKDANLETGVKNLYVCPDEAFEVDLDLNFQQAL